jgi:glycosyltransferase involved in cell wall biosynthesis
MSSGGGALPTRRLRVCHVITKLELGGAQQNTLYTVAHLDRALFEPSLIAGPGGLLDEDAARIGDIAFETSPRLVREVDPRRDPLSLADLTRRLRRLAPHVVHTHSSKAGVLGRAAAALAGVPVIVHSVHGWGFHPFQTAAKRSLFVAAERLAAAFTTHWITVSRANAEAGLAHGILSRERCDVIRSGIALQRFSEAGAARALRGELGLAEDVPLVGMVACLKPQKAPTDFVEVAAEVCRAHPRAHFVLAGDGELRGEVEQAVARTEVGDRFHLLGWRRDPETVIGSLDVLVLTSRHEGLPRVLPEAMAAVKPVVATAVDGSPEAVADGVNGRLHRVGDVAGMARSVAELLESPELAERFGRAGRERVAEWDIDRMVRQQERLYARLARRAGVTDVRPGDAAAPLKAGGPRPMRESGWG